MNSPNKFNQEQALIELTNVHLAFDLHVQRFSSVKDLFVDFFQHPLITLTRPKDIFICLNDISFSIREGDRIAILGKNGSGKTSLCHLISGNFRPVRGTIERQCQVRSIFSTNTYLFPDLTGKENAKVLGRLLYPNLSTNDLVKIVDEAIEFAEIKEFENVPIKNYSKGMAARLILSLFTSSAAELLIMDEVFDGADQFFLEKFYPRLEDTILKSKSTLFISHNVDILTKHCNRAIVLHKGKIIFDGGIAKGIFCYQNIS
jgi:ABC-type polysaccharide/polyol phosphate transport system ATPase subunit